MGEACKDALRVNFDRKLKLEFHGVKVTSDAGLLAYWKGVDTSKALLSSTFSQKLPRQRRSLTAQDVFGKVVAVVRRRLCFLSV